MASIWVRGNKNRVYIKYKDADGIEHQKPTPFCLEKITRRDGKIVYPLEILQFKKNIEAQIRLGLWELVPQLIRKIKISQAIEEFLQTYGARLKPRTQKLYRLAAKKMISVIDDCYLSSINESKMIEFRNSLLKEYNEQTAAMFLRNISPLLTWGVRKGYIHNSPVSKRTRMNPAIPPPIVYSDEELDKIIAHLNKTDKSLANQLNFLLLTGFRAGESCSLTWDRIDQKAGIIKHYNEKESRWDYYPMDRALLKFFAKLPHSEDTYVFKYRDPGTLHHYLRKHLDILQISKKKIVHALKKTYVSRIIESGASEAEAHSLSHHRSFQTTLKYYTFFKLDHKRAVLERSRKRRKKEVK